MSQVQLWVSVMERLRVRSDSPQAVMIPMWHRQEPLLFVGDDFSQTDVPQF